MTDPAPLILLVDDDADFLAMNRRVLEAAGYRVQTASDPDEALRLMAEETPALVLTDLMMKALDAGLALGRTIKGDPRWGAVPVILVTSVTSQMGFDLRPRTAEDLRAMRADTYFDKPVPPRALLEKIRELLGG